MKKTHAHTIFPESVNNDSLYYVDHRYGHTVAYSSIW